MKTGRKHAPTRISLQFSPKHHAYQHLHPPGLPLSIRSHTAPPAWPTPAKPAPLMELVRGHHPPLTTALTQILHNSPSHTRVTYTHSLSALITHRLPFPEAKSWPTATIARGDRSLSLLTPTTPASPWHTEPVLGVHTSTALPVIQLC